MNASGTASGGPARPPAVRPPIVLGMGNLLYGDEGVGVCAARCLQDGYAFSPAIDVQDGAVLGFGVIDAFEDGGPVLVLDAMTADAPAGTVFRLTERELLDLDPGIRLAAHEVEPLAQLRWRAALGQAPATVLIGMTVSSTALGVGLSRPVTGAFDRYLTAALDQLREWGVASRPLARLTAGDALARLTARAASG